MKPREPWRLPWSGAHVPHALLDIIRGCNITCAACYSTLAPRVKPLAEVEAELTALQRRRHLASVSIIGGETLLHPQLCDIIRLVKTRRLGVEVFTNGVLLDDAMAAKLKAAGTDAIFLHIERAQQRPDLPANATAAELRACWAAKTQLVARHGMDAGLTLTTCAERLEDVDEIIRFVVESDATQYLLVTLLRNLPDGLRIGGDVDAAGRVVHCLHCPDAVMQNGRLLPVCLLDKNASGAF